MQKHIDLNCDMGELPEAVVDGTQEALMRSITSVNVACGEHAGDKDMMEATVRQALRWKVAIGAHPGYPDRANFGRIELNLAFGTIADSVFEQVRALAEVASKCGARLTHVKPHGALYNQAARDRRLAKAIASGVARWCRDVIMVGLAASAMLEVFREAGFAIASEAFTDRVYEGEGSLRSRKFKDALIYDPDKAAQQAFDMVQHGMVRAHDGSEVAIAAQTLCIHGDTPGAPGIAASVVKRLKQAGIGVRRLDTCD